jgi:glycine/D-amino acid oxidase-like deaminating enzyme
MPPDAAADLSRLSDTVERLAKGLERMERRQRRTKTIAAAGAMVAAGFLLGSQVGGFDPKGMLNEAQAQATPSGAPSAPRDPAAVAADREAMLKRLSPEQRRDVEQFEQDIAWVSGYLHLYGGQFDPAAMVALMLGRMAKSVEAVPEMRTEMQVMNAKMNALPALAIEVQGMNAKMGVIAAGMDSTMGRAGRMMPWSW